MFSGNNSNLKIDKKAVSTIKKMTKHLLYMVQQENKFFKYFKHL